MQTSSSSELIKNCLERVDRTHLNSDVVLIRYSGDWSGPDSVKANGKGDAGTTYKIAVGIGPLHIRQILSERDGSPIAILTDVVDKELGSDLKARIYRRKIQQVDPWDAVKSIFKASRIHLTRNSKVVVQGFLDMYALSPEHLVTPAPAGMLDESLIWREIFSMVGLTGTFIDTALLVQWCDKGGNLDKIPQPLLDYATEEIVKQAGPGSKLIAKLIETGNSHCVVPFGAACKLITLGNPSDAQLIAARTRLEGYVGGIQIENSEAEGLGNASIAYLDEIPQKEGSSRFRRIAQDVEAFLKEIRADEYSYLIPSIPTGWDQRLRNYAKTLTTALQQDSTATQSVATALSHLTVTGMSALQKQRFEKAQKSFYLLRWLCESAPKANQSNLNSSARTYRDEVSWVDRARFDLMGGDENPEVTGAFDLLEKKIQAKRDEFNTSFGTLVAQKTNAGRLEDGIVGIEDVLGKIVKPLLHSTDRILLVVLDGLSWDIMHRLIEELTERNWSPTRIASESEDTPLVGAMIPTITSWSRASLFAGEPFSGESSAEKSVFSQNSILSAETRPLGPILFHKAELTEGPRSPKLAAEVLNEIAKQERKLVAAVVNAIDDRLSGASQKHDDWSISSIRPLEALFHAARENDRTVILASDHGHVWHSSSAERGTNASAEFAGNRHRLASDPNIEGELEVSGPRVLKTQQGEKWKVATIENLYHGPPRNGYHGGITPQEFLAPLVVFRHRSFADFNEDAELTFAPPRWWSSGDYSNIQAPEIQPVPASTSPRPKATPIVADNQPAWLDELMSSEIFANQKALISARSLKEEELRKILSELHKSGYRTSIRRIMQIQNQPVSRAPGFLSHLCRLLNVEGYEVISFDLNADWVKLDLDLLKIQFDL